ncbi:mitochondrial enolase superfamily member 1-like [Liolophura sinensis]|uniref:mitochondrial enolase superfamily member 1-like n=1 Tax=Liolophura sinensis TaxID=3198878 RepID=UPI0031598208
MTRPTVIREISARDIRFPTTLEGDGSDAMNEPDYSCAYVVVKTDTELEGYGLTFTVGKGNEIVCCAIKAYTQLIVGKRLADIFADFGGFYRDVVQHGQLRWLGPEKGVTHLATAAIFNALWDLWARMEGKPVWKLLADMAPEQIVSLVDFRYINDLITREEAIGLLKAGQQGKEDRLAKLLAQGYPAYTTSCGWLGYPDDKIRQLCEEALTEGFDVFKMKVGADVQDDIRRIQIIREMIGPDRKLMTDANQRWDVNEAIDWMKKLAPFKPYWIEEPTCPDDILGHATIAKALNPLGIGVATGEQCQNRIMFKQFLRGGALQFCQIDSCRLGSLNEIIAVLLMAAKVNIPVCPHGGGVGLCEYIQHISMFDYLCVSGSMENRVTEYVDHLHEHFVTPVIMKKGHYQVPQAPGYSIEMKADSLDMYEYPKGKVWQKLFDDGIYERE